MPTADEKISDECMRREAWLTRRRYLCYLDYLWCGATHQNCDKSVMGDEIHFLYECTKLNNLRAKYLFSPDIRREPNVFNFVNIMQTNDPEIIGNLAKFILHGLKLLYMSIHMT